MILEFTKSWKEFDIGIRVEASQKYGEYLLSLGVVKKICEKYETVL